MSDLTRKKLVLIDGHGLAYRMFFAISQQLKTRSGEPTNATMGFTRALVNLITDDNPPDYLAVSFDVGRTFRDDMFDDYKATREKMPDDLALQIDRIHEILEAFNIPILEVDGYEADDVLGTVARMAGEMDLHTLIITGDRDLLQLVNDSTTVQLPVHQSSEVENFDAAAVEEKYGIKPAQIVDYKALVGDTSDNIPGVPGIGDKTAVALLQQYGTLAGIYENFYEISGKRARTSLEGSRDQAYLSYELAKIVTDVPLEFDLDACRTHDFDPEKILPLFQELEFRTLLKQLQIGLEEQEIVDGQQLPLFGGFDTGASASRLTVGSESPTNTHIVTSEIDLAALVEKLNGSKGIAFDTETTSIDQMQARLVGIALAVDPGEGYYIPVGHSIGGDDQLPLELVIDKLRPPLTNPDVPKYGHNIKYDAIIMARHGLPVYPLSFDTMIGESLLRPDASWGKLGLKSQVFVRLGIQMTEIEALIGRGKKQITMDLVPVEQAAPYAAADADMTLRLQHEIEQDLKRENLTGLFYDLEMPLVSVLVEMEMNGIVVDAAILDEMSIELGQKLGQLIGHIYEIVGYEFNINSTQQLSKVLFEDLKLPTQGLRKTRSGLYSTAADVLDGLKEQDETGIIKALLEYRELEKLRSTYVDALPDMINPETGRIHSSFNQIGAATGRLSSSDPNLQNIPVRTELGRRVRNAFVAAPGHVLIGADYSQVELRILAHMSGDEALKQAFLEKQDIHATTAAVVNNIPLEEVTPAQRSFAKAVNFGLLYGMGAFRLARDSELTLAEAEAFITAYFERFPKVRSYLDGTKQQAAEQGYVETLLGRRRYFHILQSSDTGQQAAIQRRAAEREAINMPIQGTAADIIKIAMIKLHQKLHEINSRAKIILQIHDELILEVVEEEAEETAELVREVMQNAYLLSVPLKVDAHIGKHWGELK